MWNEHNVVIVFVVGDILAFCCRSFFDESPTFFTCEVATLIDVDSHLRDVGRIFPEVGLDDRDAPAHCFEKDHILPVKVLVCLA